jgi:hypothetical protein
MQSRRLRPRESHCWNPPKDKSSAAREGFCGDQCVILSSDDLPSLADFSSSTIGIVHEGNYAILNEGTHRIVNRRTKVYDNWMTILARV